MDEPEVEGFDRLDGVDFGGIELPVFVSQQGSKPLICLHELPGMTPAFIIFCNRMAEEGYKVYMPLMFGKPYDAKGNCGMLAFCISREFRRLFSRGKYSKDGRAFPKWLLHLTNLVCEKNPGRDVGVIGMCLTGGFAIAAIANKNVEAAVACQPSYPFFWGKRTLGLTTQQRTDCENRCKNVSKALVKGYRYAEDRFCSEEHMQAIEDLLGSGFDRFDDLPGKGHSTVTDNNPARNKVVTEDILKFLAERLK